MRKICPTPVPWQEAYQRLWEFSQLQECTPSKPPLPLILAGWAGSDDNEKYQRWQETIRWSELNHCSHVLSQIADSEYYFVSPREQQANPARLPLYRIDSQATKSRPTDDQIETCLKHLRSNWPQIAGNLLSEATFPCAFRGRKFRRLLIRVLRPSVQPLWGSWTYLSSQPSNRSKFTLFRSDINIALCPHEVDHIDFVFGSLFGAKSPKLELNAESAS